MIESIKYNSDQDRILQSLADRNGSAQDLIVIEEMSELQKELIKNRRGKENLDQIIDECVDVLLSVEILLRAHRVDPNQIENLIGFKLGRLRDFLPKTEQDNKI